MNDIILYHHLGLGDHFICNGLINTMAEQVDHITLPCWKHNYHTVNSLYSENNKITVFPVVKEPHDIYELAQSKNIPVLPVGFGHLKNPTCIWYEAFYKQLEIDPQYRYSKFQLPKNLPNSEIVYDRMVQTTPYIVVHDSSSAYLHYPIDIIQGRSIKDMPSIIKVNNTMSTNLLDWIKVFQNADEIHVVNSSIYWLLDSVANLTARLYYHNIRLGDPINDTGKWKYINYERQI